jgi:phosphoglycolate phosphatase-like HAD superfamily hydrolase
MTINPTAILFDLDGTLAVKWGPTLLDGRLVALQQLSVPMALVTNQGGIHARYSWLARGEPERAANYPTIESLLERLTAVTSQLPMIDRAYAAFYVGHDDYERPDNTADVHETLPTGVPFHGSWSPDWRKPQPGMLRQACLDLGVAPTAALMVGDNEDDANAATALSMSFIRVNEQTWSPDFFFS